MSSSGLVKAVVVVLLSRDCSNHRIQLCYERHARLLNVIFENSGKNFDDLFI